MILDDFLVNSETFIAIKQLDIFRNALDLINKSTEHKNKSVLFGLSKFGGVAPLEILKVKKNLVDSLLFRKNPKNALFHQLISFNYLTQCWLTKYVLDISDNVIEDMLVKTMERRRF